MFKKIFSTILNYGSQDTTYKGIFGILGACGIILHPELAANITALAMGAIGTINFCVNHKPEKDCK